MAISANVIDGVLSDYSSNGKRKEEVGNNLGYDQFLQLLCAEMQYQDPLEPTSNTDYIAQLATFSQLEATMSMENTEKNSLASSLVGKQVVLKVESDTGNTSYVNGKVDYVTYENDEIMLSVNDKLYPLSSLDTIADNEYYEAVTLSKTFDDMMKALPSLDNLTSAYENALKELREIYDGMTDYQKQFVDEKTVKTLQSYEEKMKDLLAKEETESETENETEN